MAAASPIVPWRDGPGFPANNRYPEDAAQVFHRGVPVFMDADGMVREVSAGFSATEDVLGISAEHGHNLTTQNTAQLGNEHGPPIGMADAKIQAIGSPVKDGAVQVVSGDVYWRASLRNGQIYSNALLQPGTRYALVREPNGYWAVDAEDTGEGGPYVAEIVGPDPNSIEHVLFQFARYVRAHIYVDSLLGDDGNDGLTMDSAFATLGAAETAALAHGDGVRIWLARGSEWREELDLGTLDSVTVSGYGSGALPIVNAADVIPASWQDSTDRADANTNTYSISWEHSVPAGQSNGGPSAFEDGEMLTWQTSIAAVDANPGSFYHDGATSDESPVTLYVHPTGSGDPAANGKAYEATKRQWAIRVGNNCTVSMVEACNQGHDNGAINAGLNAYVSKAVVHGSPTHDALFSSGVYDRVVGWHPHTDARTGAIILEAYVGDADGLTAAWNRCIVVGPDGDEETGIGGHTEGGGTPYTLWDVRDCALQNATCVFQDVLTGSVIRARLRNGSIQFYNDGGSSREYDVTDVWAHNDITSVTNISRAVWSRQGTVQINVDGLRAYTGNSGPIIEATNVLANGNIAVEIGQGATLTSWNFIKNTNLAHVAEWNRNIIAGPGEAMINLIGSDASAANNVLFSLGRYRLSDGAGSFVTETTLANIQANHGIEDGTLELDPELADPANGDFTPGATISNGAGLERPNIEYLDIPTSLAEARTWVLSQ